MQWFFLAFLSFSAGAKPVAYVICKLKGNVRTIRNDLSDQGVCKTFYSKSGEEKQQSEAKNPESCAKVLNNIRENLLKSNWKCRDVDPTAYSESGK